jgi:hypothetical protein
MASIQKHRAKNGTITWRVQIFVNNIRDSKSGFDSKSEAKVWAAQREAEILSGIVREVLPPRKKALIVESPPPTSLTVKKSSKTLGDVFDRYAREVSSTKIGYRWERIRLYKLSLSPLAATPLSELGPEHLAQWRDDRLKQVSTSTVTPGNDSTEPRDRNSA